MSTCETLVKYVINQPHRSTSFCIEPLKTLLSPDKESQHEHWQWAKGFTSWSISQDHEIRNESSSNADRDVFVQTLCTIHVWNWRLQLYPITGPLKYPNVTESQVNFCLNEIKLDFKKLYILFFIANYCYFNIPHAKSNFQIKFKYLEHLLQHKHQV